MRTVHVLTLALLTILPLSRASAADAKWVHISSAHFDMYTSESEGEAKAALVHLEAVREYFLAATHFHDPGGQTVRIVVFHAAGDYTKYRPANVLSAKAYGISAGAVAAPPTVVIQGLKPEMYEQAFREYTQLVLDDSAPTLPLWFRAGLSELYSTLKPTDAGMNLGGLPHINSRSGEVGDVNLSLLFGVDRQALYASREDFDNTGGLGGSVQSSMSQSQDFARAAWMLVHMVMFQQEYRPKFGEFMRTLAGGGETGAAFEKVYGVPLSKVKADLTLYSRQTGITVVTAPFKPAKPPAPEVRPATKEEQDKVFADLSKH